MAGPGSTSPISSAVRSSGMPSHSYKKGTVMAIICRPPFLRIRHELFQIHFYRVYIQFSKRTGVIQLRQGVCFFIVLRQNLKIQLLGPPILIRRSIARMQKRTFVGSRSRHVGNIDSRSDVQDDEEVARGTNFVCIGKWGSRISYLLSRFDYRAVSSRS